MSPIRSHTSYKVPNPLLMLSTLWDGRSVDLQIVAWKFGWDLKDMLACLGTVCENEGVTYKRPVFAVWIWEHLLGNCVTKQDCGQRPTFSFIFFFAEDCKIEREKYCLKANALPRTQTCLSLDVFAVIQYYNHFNKKMY